MVVNFGNFHPSGRFGGAYDLNEKEEAEENQLQERIRQWLSPPDPPTNHGAFLARYQRIADLFVQGGMYQEWKNQSEAALLWIHGNRAPCFTSSLILSHAVLYL